MNTPKQSSRALQGILTMNTWVKLIISYLITFAVYNIGGFESTDILMGVVFVGIYMLLGILPVEKNKATGILRDTLYSLIRELSDAHTEDHKRLKRVAAVVTFIWTLLYVIYLGDRITGGLDNPLFAAVYIILTTAGLYIGLYIVIRIVLTYFMSTKYLPTHTAVSHNSTQSESDTTTKASAYNGFPWKIWATYAILIFICMLPLFILNYPGTLTVDSFDQLSQARGLVPYDDHHPWMHTLVIHALYSIGYSLSGSVYAGIAFYTIIQMLVVAMSVSYAIVSLTDYNEKTKEPAGSSGQAPVINGRIVRILMALGFILYPYNLAYSITMWKDVLFSAAVLVLTVTIYRIMVCKICAAEGSGETGHKIGRLTIRDIILFLISSFGTCLLRHNGLYAYILTMAVIIICDALLLKKDKKAHAGTTAPDKQMTRSRFVSLLVMTLVTLFLTAIIRGPIMKSNNIEGGNFAHNLPIPLQQIARVVYDGCELTPEEIAAIENINSIEYLKEEYTPGGADPTMQWAAFGDIGAHKGEFFALWFKLGIKHPVKYISAYIDETRGYYTTMDPEQTEFYGILPNEDDLETRPLLGASIRIKFDEICFKFHKMFPVYGILYSMGACFMLLILGAAILILCDKKERLLTYLPVVTLTLTLLIATPLCADLRYAYPLMISMPSLAVITLKGKP